MRNKMIAPDANDSPCKLPYASHFTCVDHRLASYVCSACVDLVFASSCNVLGGAVNLQFAFARVPLTAALTEGRCAYGHVR